MVRLSKYSGCNNRNIQVDKITGECIVHSANIEGDKHVMRTHCGMLTWKMSNNIVLSVKLADFDWLNRLMYLKPKTG